MYYKFVKLFVTWTNVHNLITYNLKHCLGSAMVRTEGFEMLWKLHRYGVFIRLLKTWV